MATATATATATSDEDMDSLLRSFDQVYEGCKESALEIQALRSSVSAERMRRENLERSCNDLKADNERLRMLNTESLTKLVNQIKYHIKCQNLEEELKRAEEQFLKADAEHKKMLELLKQENEKKIQDLEKHISTYVIQQATDQAVIGQHEQDMAAYKLQIEMLNNRLQEVTDDNKLKSQHEIQDLRDWILIEQEEKHELHNKLQNAENELSILKAKQMEQQRESISVRHVETLKQKIMKLRKENESLKRQLSSS